MSHDALATWGVLLAQLAELGGALCRAIERADLVIALTAMTELRRVRAALARVEVPAQVADTPAERAAIASARALTATADEIDRVMRAWLARAVPGDVALLASPLGVAVLADHLLPPVWDYDTDAVVLVGAGWEQVATLLADLGQRRIVIHGGERTAAVGVATVDDAELAIAIRTMTPCPPARFVVRAMVGTDGAATEAVGEVVRAGLNDLRVHRNTVHAFSRTWIAQGAANLPAIGKWPSIEALDGKLVGLPMVIVAPGPSLAGNIATLRALRGRAIITAFSHSLKPLIAAGITPDLIVTADPQDVRYHFAGCDVSHSTLVTAATAHPSLFELGAPRCVTMSANSAMDSWMFDGVGEIAVAPGGGSVATTAYSLALRWQCDPIVFVGLDLSFPGGQYYVSTSHDGSARAVVDDHGQMRVEGWSKGFRDMKAAGGPSAVAERTIELPGWHGGTVPSSFMFSMFHRWFVERTRAVTDARVYNCTEGGSAIAGMMHRPLAEVLGQLPELAPGSVTAILDEVVAAVTPERQARLAAHIQRFVRDLARIRTLADRARTLARLAEPDADAKLAAVERKLAAAVHPLPFVSLFAVHELERAHDFAQRPAKADGYRAASATLFETLLGVIDHLTPVLRGAAANLETKRSCNEAA